MKKFFPWLMLFVILLGLGWLMDRGETKLGVPVFVWLAANLTAFLWVLARYVGRPMGEFLQARRDGIQGELRDAREKLAESEKLAKEVSARLAGIEGEVEAILEKAEEQAASEAKKIAAQAAEDEERFLKRVESEIRQREEETRQLLIQESAQLTARLARDIIAREVKDEDRIRVLDRGMEALRKSEGR